MTLQGWKMQYWKMQDFQRRPTLPSNATDADSVVRASRYALINGDTFYRGVSDADRTLTEQHLYSRAQNHWSC